MLSKITFYKAFSCLGTFEFAPLCQDSFPNVHMPCPLISIRSVFEYHLVSESLFTGVSKISYTQLSPASLLYFYCWHFPNILYLYLFILFFLVFPHSSLIRMRFMKERLCSVLFIAIFPVPGKKLLN